MESGYGWLRPEVTARGGLLPRYTLAGNKHDPKVNVLAWIAHS